MSLASLDKQTFEQFARHFEALFNDGDAAGMAACYATDARLLAEGSDLIRGRAPIEVFWQHAIARAQAAGAVRTIGVDDVISGDGLGYALGAVTVAIPGGRRVVTKYVTVWQLDDDGRWRIAVDSSSPNPPEAS
jgi:ketosteroid isomerase-like protein